MPVGRAAVVRGGSRDRTNARRAGRSRCLDEAGAPVRAGRLCGDRPVRVEAGVEAAKSGDVERLRMIIGQMFGTRVSTGADATEIVELAHLLGS